MLGYFGSCPRKSKASRPRAYSSLRRSAILMEEILNIRKPLGWTSFDVVRWIKRRFRSVKIGHAGTLDPFADGVLLVCLGRATKRIPEIMALEKEYLATLELGIETDTLDLTGNIIARCHSPVPNCQQIDVIGREFLGKICQVPPVFSAVKVAGKRSYDLARKGRSVEVKARQVEIHHLSISEYRFPRLQMRVTCSKGTYIRSLARDFAAKLGQLAYLKQLTRERIGPYHLTDAISLSDLDTVLSEIEQRNQIA